MLDEVLLICQRLEVILFQPAHPRHPGECAWLSALIYDSKNKNREFFVSVFEWATPHAKDGLKCAVGYLSTCRLLLALAVKLFGDWQTLRMAKHRSARSSINQTLSP